MLDDITPNKPFKGATANTWKQLMTCQKTGIEECNYNDISYRANKPTVFLTNSLEDYVFFSTHPDFQYEAYFIELGDTYIGPPGTQPKAYLEKNVRISK